MNAARTCSTSLAVLAAATLAVLFALALPGHARAAVDIASDADVSATLAATKLAYTGKALKPKVTVTYQGAKLVKGTDYALKYANNKEVGTATVKVTGAGEYEGSITLKFKIRKSIALNGTVKLARTSLPYTGKNRKPYATVKYGSTRLKEGTDYTIAYSNCKKVGTATVKVTGKGDYAYSLKTTYKITKNGGKIVDISEHNGTVAWKKTARKVDGAILRSYVVYTIGGHAHKAYNDGQWRADETYDANATACEKYGVPYGVYGYLVFLSKKDAVQQAKQLWKKSFSNGHKPLYLALDLEDLNMYKTKTVTKTVNGKKKKVTTYVANPSIATWTSAACDKLQELAKAAGYKNGIKILLYTGRDTWVDFGFSSTSGQKVVKKKIDSIWWAAYGKNDGSVPKALYLPAYDYDLWQYTSNGKVAGVSGVVDVSRVKSTGPFARNMDWYQKR